MRQAQQRAIEESIQASQEITAATRQLIQRYGADASEAAIVFFGAEAMLRGLNIPLGELGASRELLLSSGHADLGQWGQEPLLPEEWGDELEPVEPDPVPPHTEPWWPDEGDVEPEGPWWPDPLPEEPAPEGPEPGWVSPGPVPMRPERWRLDRDPAEYRLASGDTLAGLAGTYLGSGARWREIWDMQLPSYKDDHTPDLIYAEEWIRMPAEAAKTLKQQTGKGDDSPWPWIIGGVAIVAALGATAYTFSQ